MDDSGIPNPTREFPRGRTGAVPEVSATGQSSITPWSMLVLTVLLFSGGLFGYDQGVNSGAPRGIRKPAAATGASGAGIVTLVALISFITSFAFSMGPVVRTVINEVFPGHIRGRAVAVATAANWGSAFLVSQFFLTLIGVIGDSFTFWLFALFCALAWMWIYFRVPETKGQSLEQIQELWKVAP